ncbi:MAG: aldo/keto reductase [Acidimicrobiia bacterium]
MPQLGFGTWPLDASAAEDALSLALELGYRLLDTASFYGTESAIPSALERAEVPRADVFITSKLWNADHGFDATLRAFDRTLADLRCDELDLYLIHWPQPAHDLYSESWRAMIRLLAERRVRAIGVSNFNIEHIERLVRDHAVAPSVNQVELHPYFSQRRLRAFHKSLGIVTVAWAPLAKGGSVLADPVVNGIAARHRRAPAQILLRWHLQSGHAAIPKSSNSTRMRENIEIFDFELDPFEVDAIDALDTGTRMGADPAVTT